MWDTGGLAGGNALPRGQHPGEQPLRAERRKGGKLFRAGGQQHIAAAPGQKCSRVGGGGKHHAPGRQGAFFPQQPVILHPGHGTCSPDVFCGVHRVGVGGVYAQGSALQKGGHFLGSQPTAVHGDAVRFALFLCTQRGGNTDQNLRSQRRQLPGEYPPLGSAAENHCLHLRYPRGVTILLPSCFVAALPMYTVVNISTVVLFSCARVRMQAV